ncbi:unnamed protein product [Euphydryas editha]|uniref:Endonuclease/exonuclease/phosphatase domain-containing protein n=1 Tax=Euphydryas editha TaxID=104508 RepID=A0AAU9TDA4_EUPED|nr:unnamed protein product [Euphydryas editha]
MLISETHFTSKSYFKIPEYNLYHTMHPDGKAYGGSAILIKANIKHHQSQSYCKDYIQATNVVVYDWNNNITVSALYCPPRHTIKESQFCDYFNTLGHRFIAAGDYNAKHTFWGSRLIVPRGRELLNCIQTNNMDVVSTGQPTYWPSDRSKIPDLIDFCVTKGITRNNISCNSCWDLSSDHSPIIINIQSNIKVTLKKCTLHNKKTNWILFRYLIDEAFKVPPPLKTEDDITNAVEFFNRNVQNAAWNSTPLDKYKSDAQSVAPNILDLIKEKRKTRKLWQQNRCPDTKKIFNHKVRELKQLLERDRNASFQAYLEGLDATAATDYSLWKATKKIKRPIVTSSPLRKLDLSWARSDQEKATTFAEHLEKVFQPHPYEGSPEHEKEVIRFIDIPDQDDIEPDYFTKSEVENIIKKANSKKAPGYDLITNKVLQELPDSGITLLTAIYNAITKLKLIPPQWKVAQIIMLLKPNKQPEDPKSYRPISLL